MVFFNHARVDGLQKRCETPAEMTEYFIDRDDFLHYKHTSFGKRVKRFGPQDGANVVVPRPIQVIFNSLACA
jgi:hypothetical protein